jgi:CelD/BcsL family acetyltransferase involved in cellulose biosynthesis
VPSADARRLRAEVVPAAALHHLWEAWAALHRDDPLATPFTAPGWARAWLMRWAPAARPFVIVVRDGERIVGLAPLALSRRGRARSLEMLGKEPGDYWDILAQPNRREDVVTAVGREIIRRRNEWDAFVVSCLPHGSITHEVLALCGLRLLERPPIPCPAVELPTSFEAYLAQLPARRRSNLRKHLRRLDDGVVELREVRDAAALPEAVSEFQRLRIGQWDRAGKTLTAQQADIRFRDFMVDAWLELVPQGQALVWEFWVDGRRVGIYVNLVDARAFYWYLGGFDPSAAPLGLGKIAVGHGIRSSIHAGRRWFDFTRGAEPYKYWYGSEDRMSPSLVIGHGGVRSRTALAAARAMSARRDKRPRAADDTLP